MAWLVAKNSGIFHIGFRFDGREFNRSLATRDARKANSIRHRLEETIELVNRGRLEIPHNVTDLASFLLSDGKVSNKRRQAERFTVGELFGAYSEILPEHAVTRETQRIAQVHMRHVERITGSKRDLRQIDFSDLQAYVKKRSEDKGKRGRNISPGTIKKELSTFQTLSSLAHRSGLVDVEFPKEKPQFPVQCSKPPFQTLEQIQRRIARGGISDSEITDLWNCLYLNRDVLGEILIPQFYITDTKHTLMCW